MKASNSHGNDNRGVRRFLRESGIAPTVANVEKMAREVRRSPSENERIAREAKERGIDPLGEAARRQREALAREMANRQRR